MVFRVALWYPRLVSHLFSVCTPYAPPNRGPEIPLKTIVDKYIPSFGYQLQLSSGEVGKQVDTHEKVKGFMKGIYGGRGSNGEVAFNIKHGVQYHNLLKISESSLLSDHVSGFLSSAASTLIRFFAQNAEFYAREYMRNGFESPLGWYKTRSINHREERAYVKHNIP